MGAARFFAMLTSPATRPTRTCIPHRAGYCRVEPSRDCRPPSAETLLPRRPRERSARARLEAARESPTDSWVVAVAVAQSTLDLSVPELIYTAPTCRRTWRSRDLMRKAIVRRGAYPWARITEMVTRKASDNRLGVHTAIPMELLPRVANTASALRSSVSDITGVTVSRGRSGGLVADTVTTAPKTRPVEHLGRRQRLPVAHPVRPGP